MALVIDMKEKYLKAKEIVLKKYSKDDDYYPLFVLAVYSLLCEYNDDELIEEKFLETDFYIDDDSVKNIIKKNNLDIEYTDEDEYANTDLVTNYGLTNYNCKFSFDGDFYITNNGATVIIDSRCYIEMLINLLTHELNHIVKASFNKVKDDFADEDRVYCDIGYHSGIQYTDIFYSISGNEILLDVSNFEFEEVLNVFKTTDCLKHLLNMRNIIDDNRILELYDNFNLNELIEDVGYNKSLISVKPLYENSVFKDVLNSCLLDDDCYEIVSKHICDVTGDDQSFNEISYYLGEIENIRVGSSLNKDDMLKIDEYNSHIKEVVDLYLKRVNNYICKDRKSLIK